MVTVVIQHLIKVKPYQCIFCIGIVFLWPASIISCTKFKREPGPTNQMSQLLTEPERWQSYTPKQRFAMYNNMLSLYHKEGYIKLKIEPKKQATFRIDTQRLDDIFISLINTNPEDPYNSYYLYNIAGNYIERGEKVMGLWLLRSMYQQFPDLSLTNYPSIHYLFLDALGRMEDNVDYRIDAIQKILARYNQQQLSLMEENTANPRGVWLYRLGKAYEMKATEMLYVNPKLADENLKAGMKVYNQFFRMDSVFVPEEPNARNVVASKISIYNARRNWYTDPSLENLIQKVQYAIQNNDINNVLRYQANGFFVLSSDYRDEVSRIGSDIYLPYFLGGVIQFGNLTPESNDKEAWLYSTNWPFHLTTWYLYFHKIDYPVSPEIDGNWEWAGIYLGDFY